MLRRWTIALLAFVVLAMAADNGAQAQTIPIWQELTVADCPGDRVVTERYTARDGSRIEPGCYSVAPPEPLLIVIPDVSPGAEGLTLNLPAVVLNSGYSAICRDGRVSQSGNASGTCSHHGGVAQWGPNAPGGHTAGQPGGTPSGGAAATGCGSRGGRGGPRTPSGRCP